MNINNQQIFCIQTQQKYTKRVNVFIMHSYIFICIHLYTCIYIFVCACVFTMQCCANIARHHNSLLHATRQLDLMPLQHDGSTIQLNARFNPQRRLHCSKCFSLVSNSLALQPGSRRH